MGEKGAGVVLAMWTVWEIFVMTVQFRKVIEIFIQILCSVFGC